MNKRRIEVFTAGCPVCNPVVDLVTSLANEKYNEVIIYNLVKQCETTECVSKVAEYGIKRLPAIAVDGQLLSCCKNNGITKEDLINAGITEKL
ncbi:MAG: thioredoxin family protein [Bacteroidota bacterium]|nr:thioredoxin family protein [Bacteroidota bacterium]